MARLRLAGVRKSFGEVEVLRGIDLEAVEGELLVVLGPSGSGKSTTLRVAAGLEAADGGTVEIGDRDVTRLRPSDRGVAMVFQSYALFPHLDVARNISFGLAARGVPKQDGTARVREAAELVGCADLLHRKPHELSGGERQRVALARALAARPDVFLLDEPLSNLDAQLRTRTRAELKRLHQELGATMVYVTHDQVEALTLGDRVAVLERGVVAQVGTPAEIYGRPVDRFVAGFVGSPAMNFLSPETAAALGLPTDAEVGVRPEHVELADDGVAARVVVVEDAGSEGFVHLDLVADRVVARVPAQRLPEPGLEVSVRVPLDRVYRFDRETGRRL